VTVAVRHQGQFCLGCGGRRGGGSYPRGSGAGAGGFGAGRGLSAAL
jgi:hypothetical protein